MSRFRLVVATVVVISIFFINRCSAAPKVLSSHFANTLEASTDFPEEPGSHNGLVAEIRAGLDLVQLLPNEAGHRKLKEASMVISQTLQSPNPLLAAAVFHSLDTVRVKLSRHIPPVPTIKLQSFLYNLKKAVTSSKYEFPQKFAQWIVFQMDVVETAIEENLAGLSKLAEDAEEPWKPKSVSRYLLEQVERFRNFLTEGLKLMESQDKNGAHPEIAMLRQAFEKNQYHRTMANIVWDVVAEDYEESLDIDFITALQELEKRASPDLQPGVQMALEGVAAMFGEMNAEDIPLFTEVLGQWNVIQSHRP